MPGVETPTVPGVCGGILGPLGLSDSARGRGRSRSAARELGAHLLLDSAPVPDPRAPGDGSGTERSKRDP